MDEGVKSNNEAICAFLRYYKPHMGLFLLDMLCALVVALVDLMFPIVTRTVLETYLPQQMYRSFFLIIIAMGAAYLCAVLCSGSSTGHLGT